ncbi:MAG: response regulator [Polyangiaceae bacterium]|nr:response regulator [Polyangiaceae bacterium]MCW5789634.1 response regulator [Polyangiaceae bacterium]
MRKVIEITFAGEDYQTILAATAEDALAKLRAERPEVVLVDHDLQGESGYDLCQRIKSESPSTRVLILSSKQHPYDASRGGAAGADEHMDKPFDTQQLIDRVAQMLKTAPAQASAGQLEGVTAPAPAAHVAAKPRSPTLAYGTPAPNTPAAVPQASQPPPGRAQTFTGTPRPVAPAPAHHQTSAAATPPAPAVARPAAPVAAAPVAAPIAAAPVAVPAPAAPVAAAPVAAAAPAAVAAANGQLAGKLEGLGLTPAQVEAVLALSREVVEQVVWEVVPVLAETLIQEEIQRLTQA